jgi:hypothetical protein
MEALKKIKQQKSMGEVEDLVLDETKIVKISKELKEEIEKLEDLVCLSLNSTQLESLENFPKCPGLIRLELINNKFPGSDLKYLLQCESLQSLSLSNNTISSINDLKPLSGLEDLIQLDLEETEFSKNPKYREQVFAQFGKLKILDNKDANGENFDYSDEDGDDYNDEDDEGSMNDEDDDGEGNEGDFEGSEDGGEEDDFDEEDDISQDDDDEEYEESDEDNKMKKNKKN